MAHTLIPPPRCSAATLELTHKGNINFDLILPIKLLGAPEIVRLNLGSKKHGFFRVCGHRPRPLLGQNFNMAKGVFKRLLSL